MAVLPHAQPELRENLVNKRRRCACVHVCVLVCMLCYGRNEEGSC